MNYKTELKSINSMACPILLNYLLMSIFEILDKAIVGHYSVRSFAVIGIAAGPIFEITGALGILSVAFNILAAKQKGSGDTNAFEETFTVSRELALLIGGTFFLLSLIGGRLFFRTVYGQEGEVLVELLSYFYPASLTVVQNMLIFQYSAYYRNKLNTKISFYSTAVSAAVNLFFDLSLVHGLFGMPRLGTAGAAWGSVIGLGAGLLVYQIPYYRQKCSHSLGLSSQKETLNTLWKLYPSLLGQEFLESTLFVVVVSGTVARRGTEQMAVYSLLDTVRSTLGLPIYAYATAAQTYACQSSAAGHLAQARRYLNAGQLFTAAVTAALCLLCFLWQAPIFAWIVSDTAVIREAGTLLVWIFAGLLAKISYQFYMGYLQGTGREAFVFNCAAVSTVIASLATILLGHLWGLPGIYFVITAEAAVLSAVYVQKSNHENRS